MGGIASTSEIEYGDSNSKWFDGREKHKLTVDCLLSTLSNGLIHRSNSVVFEELNF